MEKFRKNIIESKEKEMLCKDKSETKLTSAQLKAAWYLILNPNVSIVEYCEKKGFQCDEIILIMQAIEEKTMQAIEELQNRLKRQQNAYTCIKETLVRYKTEQALKNAQNEQQRESNEKRCEYFEGNTNF